MSDHIEGMRYLDGEKNFAGSLVANDCRHSCMTACLTFSLGLPFNSIICLNYEKCFYRDGAVAEPSEKD